MDDFVMPFVLGLDISSLTMSLVNITSPDGAGTALADSVEAALRLLTHLDVERRGDTVVARTVTAHAERVVVAGHLDTAPVDHEPLAYVEMGKLYGPGASDAKGAAAVALRAAAAGGFGRDVMFVLGDLDSAQAEVSAADLVVLAAPTDAVVVGGAIDHPAAESLVALSGVGPVTDPSGRFAALGVPTVAFGPGDPSLARTADEFIPTAQLTECEFVLRQWLAGQVPGAGTIVADAQSATTTRATSLRSLSS